MTGLPMDCWAQRREICLTLEEGPGGLSPIDSFIVLLSAREVVTPQQLRQTLVYKFAPAISGFKTRQMIPPREETKSFSDSVQSHSKYLFVVVHQKICHYEAWALPPLPLPHVKRHLGGLLQPRLPPGLCLASP